jgi:putative PIN family toxin of toxin-antitoxin system
VERKPRVIIDTGVVVSGFVFGGIPKEALLQVFKKAEVWVSPDILNEYREVSLELEEVGKISREQLRVLVAGIAALLVNAEIIYPERVVSVCRDAEDNILLDACLAAKADYLITGDRDLLDLDSNSLRSVGLKKLKILNPRDFISKIK